LDNYPDCWEGTKWGEEHGTLSKEAHVPGFLPWTLGGSESRADRREVYLYFWPPPGILCSGTVGDHQDLWVEALKCLFPKWVYPNQDHNSAGSHLNPKGGLRHSWSDRAMSTWKNICKCVSKDNNGIPVFEIFLQTIFSDIKSNQK
jgi:hypothetical protein